jgi:vacuolar-type H+-ATPase subunit E/Vma4
MGIEKVRDLIIDSAKKKADKMIEAAKIELENELKEFEKTLNEEYEIKLNKAKKEIDEEIAREKTVEIPKIAKEKLLRKKKMLDEFFEKLKGELLKDEKSYLKLLFNALKNDLVDYATIYLNENDLKKFRKEIEKFVAHELKLKNVKVADSPIDIDGGVIIKTESYEVDDSLDSIINAFREEKEIEIAKEIFG